MHVKEKPEAKSAEMRLIHFWFFSSLVPTTVLHQVRWIRSLCSPRAVLKRTKFQPNTLAVRTMIINTEMVNLKFKPNYLSTYIALSLFHALLCLRILMQIVWWLAFLLFPSVVLSGMFSYTFGEMDVEMMVVGILDWSTDPSKSLRKKKYFLEETHLFVHWFPQTSHHP